MPVQRLNMALAIFPPDVKHRYRAVRLVPHNVHWLLPTIGQLMRTLEAHITDEDPVTHLDHGTSKLLVIVLLLVGFPLRRLLKH